MLKIVLYTNSFPFGDQETFLEEEIKYLSASYEQVIIFPLKIKGKGDRKSELPPNCVVLEPLFNPDLKSFVKYNPIFTFKVLMKSLYKYIFRNEGGVKNIFFAESVRLRLISGKQLKYLMKCENIQVHYFYWSFGLIFGIDVINKFIPGARIVNRFHGFDLYEERSSGKLPYRKEIYNLSNLLIFISEQGRNYFLDKNPSYKNKTTVSYLGVRNRLTTKLDCEFEENIELHFLSCSNVISLKRVNDIFSIINQYAGTHDYKIKWTHIGDGPDFNNLKNLVKNKVENLTVELLGRVRNSEIQRIYEAIECKKVFMNLSTSEGLPVSIMEACRSNIPVIATNVGGTCEIVDREYCGVLVNKFYSQDEILKAIDLIFDNYDNYTPREVWKKKFDANTNYKELIQKLECINIR
ncbi:glycosyltransferase [Vibrio natriegens]|uniref:glycosyltransferase n=1 Tax=Vibrio natriegens TaxID=691 RepID=UPI001FBBC765|nr:glycosyltransferase [Vibrio natriegens]